MARLKKEYSVYLIKVDKKKCNGCGKCFDYCPVNVFKLINKKSSPLHPENCLGCGTCLAICETNAILITEI